MVTMLTAPIVLSGDDAIVDGALVIDDRVIAWVGPQAQAPAEYADAPRTDHPGATIMPGLIDSHVHLAFDGGPAPVARMRAETDEQQLILMLRSARELLGVGVTTARDLGARNFLDVTVRDAIAADLARGPRMLVAARPITTTGGHCWFMGGEADSPDEVRRIVREHHKRGANLMKVMSTGGFMTQGSAPWYAQFGEDLLSLVVVEALRVGKGVAAHAHGLEGIRRAVAADVTTIEHCTFVDDNNDRVFDPALAEQIAAKGIWVCPTVNANAARIAEKRGIKIGEFLLEMKSMGVKIIAGTDAGIDNTPHHQYVGGLEHLARLGFTGSEVLAMATTEAAAALGVENITGRLQPGFEADVIVVDGDPRSDITALRRLRRVIARGRDYVPDSGTFDVDAPGLPPLPEGPSLMDIKPSVAPGKSRR